MNIFLDFDCTISVVHTVGKDHSGFSKELLKANIREAAALKDFVIIATQEGHHIHIATFHDNKDHINAYLEALLGDDWDSYITSVHYSDAEFVEKCSKSDSRPNKNEFIKKELKISTEEGVIKERVILVDDDPHNIASFIEKFSNGMGVQVELNKNYLPKLFELIGIDYYSEKADSRQQPYCSNSNTFLKALEVLDDLKGFKLLKKFSKTFFENEKRILEAISRVELGGCIDTNDFLNFLFDSALIEVNLKDNQDFMCQALEVSSWVYFCASESLQKEPGFLLGAIKLDPSIIGELDLDESIKQNSQFLNEVLVFLRAESFFNQEYVTLFQTHLENLKEAGADSLEVSEEENVGVKKRKRENGEEEDSPLPKKPKVDYDKYEQSSSFKM